MIGFLLVAQAFDAGEQSEKSGKKDEKNGIGGASQTVGCCRTITGL
jgi:hypothetical protein